QTTQEPEKVKQIFMEKWRNVFKAPSDAHFSPDAANKPWFQTASFRAAAERIQPLAPTLTSAITAEEIRETLTRMQPKTSTDPSGLSIGLLKQADDECIAQLLTLFNDVLG